MLATEWCEPVETVCSAAVEWHIWAASDSVNRLFAILLRRQIKWRKTNRKLADFDDSTTVFRPNQGRFRR
jgi:hypothetical protein